MDQERFQQALVQARTGNKAGGVGVLREKALHAAVKYYLEPDPACHERPYQGFVADIVNDRGVFEVQTGSFASLKRKLEVFLAAGPLTLVCPLARRKWLGWLDPATGETTNLRRSPKLGTGRDAFRELIHIGPWLGHPHLTLLLLLLDLDEIRSLDGWSRDKKRGSTRLERLPRSLEQEIWLRQPADWDQLLPDGLPRPFTARDWTACTQLSPRSAGAGLTILRRLDRVRPVGQQGRARLYLCTRDVIDG